MGKLKLYDTSLSRELITSEREQKYLRQSSLQKFRELLALIHLNVQMNGGKPVKYPQGKGLIIRKEKS